MDFGFVDLLLLAVVAIGVFLGFKRGFLIVASKPIKIIAALALTFSFAPLLVTGWTGPYFNELFFGRIHEYILTNCPEITAQTAAESMPTVLKIAIALLKIDLTGESAAEGIAAAIAAPVGNLVAIVVTYVIFFFAVMLLLSLAISLVDKVLSAGPLNIVNKALGVVIGLAFAVVACCILSSLISFAIKDFTGGAVFEFFKNLNPLEIILSF